MSRRKRKKTNRPTLNFAEVDAPGGIVTKSGKRIDGKVLVPDGDIGYGDSESLALMTGDVVARVSTDSTAGDRAYESAREQATQDQVLRSKLIGQQMTLSGVAAADAFWISELNLWGLRYLRAEPDGSITEHFTSMTDQQAGDMVAQHEERTGEKVV